MKKKTRILLEITWDDEIDSHPSQWDLERQIIRDPFSSMGETVDVLSFEDVEDDE